MATLRRLAAMGIRVPEAEGDPDLASLRATPAFDEVLRAMNALESPLGTSTVAFTLAERDLAPEGIAHDPKTGAFFLTSVRKRKVVRVAPDGSAADLVPSGRDGMLATLAIALDGRRRALWVSTEAVPGMEGLRKEDEGRSALLELDADTGRLRRSLDPPGARDACVGDLAVGTDGTVYASDPRRGRLYVLPPGAKELAVLVPEGRLGSPQGLAPSPDGRWLFFADYTLGIVRADLRSCTRSGCAGPEALLLLDTPGDAAVTGIDGLVWAGDGLVGIQNGLRPHRVVRLRLAASMDRITSLDLLERAHPRFDEPTLGVRVGADLYYVATSGWPAIGADGAFDVSRVRPPTVLRLRLRE